MHEYPPVVSVLLFAAMFFVIIFAWSFVLVRDVEDKKKPDHDDDIYTPPPCRR
jgi:hypothetical protein